MDFSWIRFTLIWIMFYENDRTSATSLRNESQSEYTLTNPETELNHPTGSFNYRSSYENLRQRNRYPYNRKNRQIYTSKTYFGRKQQIGLPRTYLGSRKGKKFVQSRVKTPRYEYPIRHSKIAPHDVETVYHKHNKPHVSHEVPVSPRYVSRPDESIIKVLSSNYDQNHKNVHGSQYESPHEYNPNARNQQNSQHIDGIGYVQPDNYNAEYAYYPNSGTHPRQEQYSAYGEPMEYRQGFDPNAQPIYEQGISHDQVSRQDGSLNSPPVQHERHSGNVISNSEYVADVQIEPNLGYVPIHHEVHSGNVNQAQQTLNNEYNDNDHVSYLEHQTKGKYDRDSLQNVDAGYDSNKENINGYNSYPVVSTESHFENLYSENKNIKSEEKNLKLSEEKVLNRNLEISEHLEISHDISEDQAKLVARYNELLNAEKNENSIQTMKSSSSISDSVSDENLQKEELFRQLKEDELRADYTTLATDSYVEDTFSENLEGGSGEGESSNKFLEVDENTKSGRLLDIFSRTNDTDQCTTPKNESGHCRGLTECPLLETMENFGSFLQYMCFQSSRLVGICCPDNPVIEITETTEDSSQEKLDIKQPPEGCGLSTHTRIVGGTMAIPHEFSWMVALLRRGRFYCGGVIINNWYILTAAHCVLGIKISDLKVRLGEFDFQDRTDRQLDIPVSEIKRHALFATLTFQHDIALLKLKQRIEYTKFIGSICLPNKEEGDFSARKATVVGWGTVSFGGAASQVLRQVTVPVWDNKQCDKTYVFETINDAFMCAGSPESGEDACQGDSGGPLMSRNENGRWSVIGIVSWGRRCGDPTYPGVYTRVTSYVDWIAENAQ